MAQKHMIRRASTPSRFAASAAARWSPSMTVAKAMPRAVWALRVEEDLDVADVSRPSALE